MKSKENFQKKLKLLRESLKLNQKEFAESIEVTQATLSAYELGKQVPASPVLLLISEKYNVSIDWLFEDSTTDNNLHIETYSDLFNVLALLSKYFEIESNNVELDDMFCPLQCMYSFDDEINTFLKGLNDMDQLLKSETISQFVFDAWKSETLKKYENELINKKSN